LQLEAEKQTKQQQNTNKNLVLHLFLCRVFQRKLRCFIYKKQRTFAISATAKKKSKSNSDSVDEQRTRNRARKLTNLQTYYSCFDKSRFDTDSNAVSQPAKRKTWIHEKIVTIRVHTEPTHSKNCRTETLLNTAITWHQSTKLTCGCAIESNSLTSNRQQPIGNKIHTKPNRHIDLRNAIAYKPVSQNAQTNSTPNTKKPIEKYTPNTKYAHF